MNEILIIVALILLNGIFSLSEVALISARTARLQTDAKRGNKAARKALELAGNPDRFLSTVQIGITLIGILTGIYSGSKLAADGADLLMEWGLPGAYASPLAQSVIVVIVTFLTIVLGELVPKRIGLALAEPMAKFMARPMDLLARLASPFVWLLSKSTEAVVNLLGIRDDSGRVTEEEIKSIIKEGAEGGVVDPVEQDIMQRVFLLGDMKVSSIMTHKSDVVWLDARTPLSEVSTLIGQHLYEAYPVAEGDLDHVVGMVGLKDLVMHLREDQSNVGMLVHKATYFHEGMSIYKVLEQMKQKRLSRALICDEFGDFVGLITLKDLLEALVGHMNSDEEEPEITPRSGGDGWLVDGQCPLYDMLCHFDCGELYEEADYHTLAGLLLDKLQRIPHAGDTLEWNGFHFEVVDMDGARIDKVIVRRSE